ncbi:MAG: hypothetical protein F6K19_01385 [Cyanothece sp. SIO1E1]|nr:hypothetical protein [Cyanothece sp. SIO1E1]
MDIVERFRKIVRESKGDMINLSKFLFEADIQSSKEEKIKELEGTIILFSEHSPDYYYEIKDNNIWASSQLFINYCSDTIPKIHYAMIKDLMDSGMGDVLLQEFFDSIKKR